MRVLDLFSGIGGFSLGLEAAGMKTVAFCEREPFCQAVLKKHWPYIPCHDDVTTLDGKQYNGTIDVIAGGFPCQDISLAGKGAGLAGERSGLWFEYLRIIKEAQPRYVIIENVSALRSRGLEEVLRSLDEIGYDAEWHCIPASAIGAPHQRDRVWIVAYTQSQRHTRREPANEASQERKIKSGGEAQRVRFAEPSDTHRIRNGEVMADPNTSGCLRQGSPQSERRECDSFVVGGGENVSNTLCERLEGQRTLASRIGTQLKDLSYSRWWEFEPPVGRVANGVSLRVDRIKSLGNSIVPQIAEVIGQAIMQAEG